ncbi:MAG: hypothetical protein JW749_12005 [Sedimentisphaerales bacterium]|nr:hypothetical protein [Sedimentisphaerales bacterium]
MKTHIDTGGPVNSATVEQPSITSLTGTGKTKSQPKYQTKPFQPKPSLLLDILPAEEFESGVKEPPTPDTESDAALKSNISQEDMLQQLLLNTEKSANRTQSSRMKWQVSSLILLMLLLPMVFITGGLYIENIATGARYGRLQVDNRLLQEQLNSAGIHITGLKGELDTLLNRNLELAGEVANLCGAVKTQAKSEPSGLAPAETAVIKTLPRPAAVAEQYFDPHRIEAMRKGTFPNGVTKDELIAVLGQPDRIYTSRNYEQFVFFGRKPHRFWFIGNWLVQTSN